MDLTPTPALTAPKLYPEANKNDAAPQHFPHFFPNPKPDPDDENVF
jgi:hypothetical protein